MGALAKPLACYGFASATAPFGGHDRIQHFWPEGVFKRFEPAGLVIEVTEIVIHEADEPDLLAHLFDAHLLPGEHGAEVDFLPIEADAPACGHRDRLVMERVIELGQTGIGPR